MPFPRPTLSTLRAQTRADIAANLDGAQGLLRYSNLGIMGDVLSALTNGLYGYLDWIALQAVPFTATDEYLEAWAALKGVTRKPAASATASASFSGTNGSVIAAGAQMSRADGQLFQAGADATVTAGTAIVDIVAVSAGAASNAPSGMPITLTSPISGVSSAGFLSSDATGGADVEDDASLRGRMLKAYSAPPQGGALGDYELWALDVPGVTRAWAIGNSMGPGTVSVFFMMDDSETAHGGFPQGTDGVAADEERDTAASGDQLAVADAIFTKQPVTALVYAVAPLANTINITIAGIASASTATKAAISLAFAAALQFSAKPGGVTPISAIELAIASIGAATGFVITGITASAGTVTPGSAGNITSTAGHLPVAGTITYAA